MGGSALVKPRSFDDLRKDRIRTWYLYWVVARSSPQIPIYIGITVKPKRRAIEHKSRSIDRLRNVRQSSCYLLTPIRSIVGNFAAARFEEAAEIKHHIDRGITLANVVCQRSEPAHRFLVVATDLESTQPTEVRQ